MKEKLIRVTDLSSYLYCPRKLFLKKVKGWQEKPSKKMILGFLKHKVFELFSEKEKSIIESIGQEVSEEEIKSLYKNNLKKMVEEVGKSYRNMVSKFRVDRESLWREILEFMKKEIELRVEIIKKAINKGYLGEELWKNLRPKYRTEYKVASKKLGLRGKVDRVSIGSQVVPYEIKTKKKIYFSDKIQLASYALLLEEEFNKEIEKGVVESKEGRKELYIDDQLREKVMEIVEKVKSLNELPEIQSNFNKCRHCRLKDRCFDIDE